MTFQSPCCSLPRLRTKGGGAIERITAITRWEMARWRTPSLGVPPLGFCFGSVKRFFFLGWESPKLYKRLIYLLHLLHLLMRESVSAKMGPNCSCQKTPLRSFVLTAEACKPNCKPDTFSGCADAWGAELKERKVSSFPKALQALQCFPLK